MYTKEIKQKFFTHAVTTLNGKGRALNENRNSCAYTVDGHPGCAIGCQPEFAPFKERFRNDPSATLTTVFKVIEIFEAFHKPEKDDIQFLNGLQSLHDCPSNWDDSRKFWEKRAVVKFANNEGLEVPDVEYKNDAQSATDERV